MVLAKKLSVCLERGVAGIN